jgi:hypothetical protein
MKTLIKPCIIDGSGYFEGNRIYLNRKVCKINSTILPYLKYASGIAKILARLHLNAKAELKVER